jgi:hypothetical protein
MAVRRKAQGTSELDKLRDRVRQVEAENAQLLDARWRATVALRITPGNDRAKLRAMRRELEGRTGRGRRPVINGAALVRDWRLMTDPTPSIDADGRTLLQGRTLGYYGLVPECSVHTADEARGVYDQHCQTCQLRRIRATVESLALLGRWHACDPRLLVLKALRHVHACANDDAAIRALLRHGAKGTPALRWG